jgi:hypothetical protein
MRALAPTTARLGAPTLLRPRARGAAALAAPPRRARAAARGAPAARAFKENAKHDDWRIAQMEAMAHRYFNDFLSTGDEAAAEELFDDASVHLDAVWDATHPSVGARAIRHYLHDLRAAFPDFTVRVTEMAAPDTTSLWVHYEGTATGLGAYHGHRASHHASAFSGVNVLRFAADRARIAKVLVYRSAFAEDRAELAERVPEGGFRELRLKRLV